MAVLSSHRFFGTSKVSATAIVVVLLTTIIATYTTSDSNTMNMVFAWQPSSSFSFSGNRPTTSNARKTKGTVTRTSIIGTGSTISKAPTSTPTITPTMTQPSSSSLNAVSSSFSPFGNYRPRSNTRTASKDLITRTSIIGTGSTISKASSKPNVRQTSTTQSSLSSSKVSSSFSPFGHYKSSSIARTRATKDLITRTSVIGTGRSTISSTSKSSTPSFEPIPSSSSSSSLKAFASSFSPSSIIDTGSTSTTITSSTPFINSIDEASQILSKWDEQFVGANPSSFDSNKLYDNINSINNDYLYTLLPDAVRYLNMVATKQYEEVGKGRVILGVCANNAADGTRALKSWVTELQLPRGLLYGLDENGVPKKNIGNSNGLYLKYNSLYAKKRKSKKTKGVAIAAIERKPGDVLASSYSGKYRGVYFQVELKDQTFRQYLLPANLF